MGGSDRLLPAERHRPDQAWRLDDLSSACPAEDVSVANRFDPYWDGLWGTGARATWLNVQVARQQESVGIGRLPQQLGLDLDTAVDRLHKGRNRDALLSFLGSLFSYRTITAEQMAAVTGEPTLARALSAVPAALFAAGITDLGFFTNGLFSSSVRGRGTVYRPSRGDSFDRHVLDSLTGPEWAAVTGGQRWGGVGWFDRHNVLSTELLLRAAELCDVGAVLGERFASFDLLSQQWTGRQYNRAADGVIVRRDGLRIAVEVTASLGQRFTEKATQWTRTLAQAPLSESGLAVVFVIAQQPELVDSGWQDIRARVYQTVAGACREFPGSRLDRVAERVGVATWREWFPGRGLVDEGFFGLRVDRPTGEAAALWEPCDMLSEDELGFAPDDMVAAQAVVSNAALLGQSPVWMRQGAPTLWQRLLEFAPSGVPSPTPSRANRGYGKGWPLGHPPRRLLGL